jgi:hypothetical protein
MSWGKKQIAGVVYDLGHLDPFLMDVTPKAPGAPTYAVRVSFGLHTFTRELLSSDPPDHHMTDGAGGTDVRCFCPVRHQCSVHLPAIVQKAASGKAHFSEGKNFLLVRNLPGMNGPYAIFFDVEKAKSKKFQAAMFVSSAYVKPNLPLNLPTITVATIVSRRVQGLPIIRPKK